MQYIYYNSGSQSLAVIYENGELTTLDSIYTLYGITSVVTSSNGQINIYSGSDIIVSFPIATTDLFFGSVEQYGSGKYIVQYSQSLNLIDSSSVLLNYDVSTTYFPISNSYLQIFKSGSTFTIDPNSVGSLSVSNGDTYQVYLQRDSDFPADLYLNIKDTITGLTIFEEVSQNTYISTSLYIEYGDLFPKQFTANINSLPALSITLTNISSSSVIPPTDINGWNSYLGITASFIAVSGSNIYLSGYTLSNLSELELTSSFVSQLKTNAISSIQSLILASNSLDSVDISQYSALQYFDYSNNNFSTIIPLDNNGLLKQYVCDNNKISGSLPELYSNTNLGKFSCKNNHFTGSIPNLSNNINLQYFDCSYNKISGSLPYFATNGFLQEFYCNNNFITASTQGFNNNMSLTTINCSNNAFSGSVYLQYVPNLTFFSASNNNFSGSIQSLSGCQNLQIFNISYNQLSDYTSSNMPSSLIYFNAYQNNLSEGSIENIIKDIYEAGALNGYLNLSGSGNATASLTTLETASLLEINRGWQVELNGTPTIVSASFYDNLFGFQIVPGLTDGLTGSYYSVIDTTIPLTYIYKTGSISEYNAIFRASENHNYDVGIGGWTYTTGSDSLDYTSSLDIIEISASVSASLYSAVGYNTPLSASFSSSAFSSIDCAISRCICRFALSRCGL